MSPSGKQKSHAGSRNSRSQFCHVQTGKTACSYQAIVPLMPALAIEESV
jgi:hypothetical protein